MPQPSGDDGSRLVLSQMDRQRVDKMLAEYLKTVSATYVLIVDREGVLVTMQGDAGRIDTLMVSALVAGSYEVSRQTAKALKTREFQVIFQEGPSDTLMVSRIDDRSVLAVLFGQRATLGMVRLYAKNLIQQLGSLFERVASRGPGLRPPTR